jgi:DNA-binding CsgD family transcriptional regulator
MRKQKWDEEKKEQVTTDEWETVNKAAALWTRSKSDITDAEYQEFYKQISYDQEPPLAYTHNRVEGRSEYTQLLYVPAKAPFDLWNRDKRGGVKLYVKRVFIMDDAEALMPVYLRFVKGVIDSADLPLNVSRELLQESRDVKAIREGSTKRVLGMLEDVAENQKDKYAEFWKQFGAVLKEGIGEDFSQPGAPGQAAALRLDARRRRRVVRRLRGPHEGRPGGHLLHHRRQPGRRQEQPAAGDLPQEGHRGAAADRPRRRVDAVAPVRVRGQAAAERGQGRRRPGQAAGRRREEGRRRATAEAFKPVLERLKAALKDRAKDVRTTTRLVDSPACIVVRRGRHELAPGAHAQAGRAGAPEVAADPGGERRARAGQSWRAMPASTTWRRSCSTRPAGRRRAARRPGGLRAARQPQIYVSPDRREALLRRATGRGTVVGERPELSARELEVLRLVAAGRSTREIADQLNRSVKTIETHKQSLKVKLDADSPAMLVRKAIAFLGEGH